MLMIRANPLMCSMAIWEDMNQDEFTEMTVATVAWRRRFIRMPIDRQWGMAAYFLFSLIAFVLFFRFA
jgi:hypothetical protein